VARAFVGVARPFNFTKIVPYENRFFTGGASSVRGWQSSTLGPGTFRSDSVRINNLIAPGGEYAIELNAEYRYAATDAIQFAFFVDAGNVWFGKNSGFGDSRALLTKDNLELGVAAGVGLRFDTSFFILRLDVGQQIYAPDVRTIVVRRLSQIGNNRIQYNIGIGYPF
jgi:outer membrane protein assembly factor BamA